MEAFNQGPFRGRAPMCGVPNGLGFGSKRMPRNVLRHSLCLNDTPAWGAQRALSFRSVAVFFREDVLDRPCYTSPRPSAAALLP
jgi:hypothetical protein